MSIALSREELRELTEKSQAAAQARVLQSLGIPFARRPGRKGRKGGSLLVLRIHAGLAARATLTEPEPEVMP